MTEPMALPLAGIASDAGTPDDLEGKSEQGTARNVGIPLAMLTTVHSSESVASPRVVTGLGASPMIGIAVVASLTASETEARTLDNAVESSGSCGALSPPRFVGSVEDSGKMTVAAPKLLLKSGMTGLLRGSELPIGTMEVMIFPESVTAATADGNEVGGLFRRDVAAPTGCVSVAMMVGRLPLPGASVTPGMGTGS